MTKAAPPLTEPATIKVGGGRALTTTIDPLTKYHLIACDICQKTIQLTKSANPNAFFVHRKSCSNRITSESGPSNVSQQDALEPTGRDSHQRQHSLSRLSTSFSHLQTASPMPSPTVVDSNPRADYFSIPVIHTSRPTRICPGIGVSWLPGSVWESYPYHQHAARAVGWMPIGFDPKANKIFLRSDKCAMELFENDEAPCTRCLLVEHSVEFKSFISRATEVKEHTPWNYLTGEQLLGLLKKMAGQLNTLRTKACPFPPYRIEN
ncbi:hypothetical protein M413DRAFT_29401 [Hebeloma cylindrosporum]|uniref:Uncharacterized protein n=1 Tax=Hebeloma cylindrosporum TaxID=76867 RepID=A0A0C2YDX8_HEBCY|nr:hypothetical protein M413DRAFT_29401 [Hebeloma cylindrosporum h7]